MKIAEYNEMMAYLMRPEPRQMLAMGTQPRTVAGTFGKVYLAILEGKSYALKMLHKRKII